MKVKNFLALACAAVTIAFATISCDDDKNIGSPSLDVSIKSRTGTFEVVKEKTITLVGVVNTNLSASYNLASTYSWSIDGVVQPTTDTVLIFTNAVVGEHTVAFTATNEIGTKTATTVVKVLETPPLDVSIKSRTGTFDVVQEKTITLVGMQNTDLPSIYSWSIDGVTQSATDTILNFTHTVAGNHTVEFTVTNELGTSSATVVINVKGKYGTGVFVLNEGSASTENGSLIHISTDGIITENVETVVNGNAFGITAQHMFFANGKIYVVSKATDATKLRRVVVLNAETLEEIADYSSDLTAANKFGNQSNIAVLGDEIYLNPQNQLYSFNTVTKEVIAIKNGTCNSSVRMHAANHKLFAIDGNRVKVFEQGKDTISNLIDFGAAVQSIARADDGNIFVAIGKSPIEIQKINTTDYSTISTSTLPAGISVGYSAMMLYNLQCIWPKGDTIYFSNVQQSYSATTINVYQHIHTANITYTIGNISPYLPYSMVYGGVAVHPKTGEIYVSAIQGFGAAYRTNTISVLKFTSGAAPGANNIKHVEDYLNYTRFAAGIYFPESYE
ncbi:MAG: DUF5074 domain-containing protein [Prevotellaceae bacterium]|jgi:hypothetical protein|nr:DUF5074 domain-containing protein [Prevotellaceae bacterium]